MKAARLFVKTSLAYKYREKQNPIKVLWFVLWPETLLSFSQLIKH